MWKWHSSLILNFVGSVAAAGQVVEKAGSGSPPRLVFCECQAVSQGKEVNSPYEMDLKTQRKVWSLRILDREVQTTVQSGQGSRQWDSYRGCCALCPLLRPLG